LAAPVNIAAVDAGSNAIRLLIARATSPDRYEILDSERASVRLGHNAFTRHSLSNDTIAKAARAFRHFRRMMDRYHVVMYRAVATSAAREARNRHTLIERIRRKSGLEIEVISGEEEARLTCAGVLRALAGNISPRLIFDLGGGSLEVNLLERGVVTRRVALPLGTVRLMETYKIEGVITEDAAARIRDHVLMLLRSALPSPPSLAGSVAVACGGNAEALAPLAAGPRLRGLPTINLRLLRDQVWHIARLDVPRRVKVFHVRRDRAEVMGIAAIVLATLGQYLNLRSMVVPGAGVREGILLDLMAAQYSGLAPSEDEKRTADRLRASAEWFGRRFNYDAGHAEQVRRVAVSLFDQLRPLHEMGPDERLALELGAILHDVGHTIGNKLHHRHGEYLVRFGDIPGLRGWRCDMVAALVRYHNCRSEPQMDHKSYASLDGDRREDARMLVALLRIAERLESGHRRMVGEVSVDVEHGEAIFRVQMQNGARLDVAGLTRKAAMFEREFGLRPVFRRAQAKTKAKVKVA
jgi:exopolyphosphatase / guanosine-5'-triphosphate,3'-diphosphate pyrophosphatase